MAILIVGLEDLGQQFLQNKYPNNFKYINEHDYKYIIDGRLDNKVLIQYLQYISNCMKEFDVVFIDYNEYILYCLKDLNTPYTLMYYEGSDYKINKETVGKNCIEHVIPKNSTLELELSKTYDWIKLDNELILNYNENRKLTLNNIFDEDVIITEQDVRDMKELQTKIKVSLLLQAKKTLNRTLKMLDVLDVLCDNLVDRISSSVDVADTASLMTTIQFITNSINEANKFIYTLINNDKIQNFFIVDSSNVINISDNRLDIDKREKIRKVIEIVLQNINNFESGNFIELQNPNKSEADNNESNQSSTT